MVSRKTLGPLLFLGACASDPAKLRDPASSSGQEKIPRIVVPRSVEDEELSEAKELQKAAAEEDVLALPKTKQGTRYGQIPYVDNPMVRKWMEYFTNKDKERFLRFLGRGEVYRTLVQAILKEEGLPEDLFYLALIESGYTIQATSHAKAVGVWQFMPATGLRYGLRIDSYVDERRDPIRATRAASAYLRDLYNLFGSWPLAMAAYNAGEGRIMGCIFRGKTRDYWSLVSGGFLPEETANYVGKFMAAATISHNLKKIFGVARVQAVSQLPELTALRVPSPVLMTDVAERVRISSSELWMLNPHLKKNMTPPSRSHYILWVPKNRVASVNLAGLQTVSSPFKNSKNNRRDREIRVAVNRHKDYRVRRGDSLTSIAERFQIEISELKRLNGLRRSELFAGEVIKVPSKNRL